MSIAHNKINSPSMKFFIKLTIMLVLLSLFSNTTAFAQSGRIRFSRSSLTVREALEDIYKQTGYGMAFNSRVFDATRRVMLTSPAPTLDAALSQILAGTGFAYTIENGIILIEEKVLESNRPPVVFKRHPETNDIYIRNSTSDFSTAPLHRPIVENPTPGVMVVGAVEEPHYDTLSSHYAPIERFAANQTKLPRWAIKTNLLYDATLTPNLTFEAALGRRTSLQITGSYNPWHLKGTVDNDKKLVHMVIKPEFRWWLCERFNGHFFGADLIFSRYNVSTYDIPLLFERQYRYDGIAYGGGITYGYHVMLGKRWGLEFAVGVGVLRLEYDRYTCATCDRTAVPANKIYIGPTNAAINLSFLLK
jgi:hypothetical protein